MSEKSHDQLEAKLEDLLRVDPAGLLVEADAARYLCTRLLRTGALGQTVRPKRRFPQDPAQTPEENRP